MISKKNSLSVEDFSKVIKTGSVYKSRFFFVRIIKTQSPVSKIGVGVSKKLAKKAVKRNYYKRVLRHLIKESLKEFKGGYYIVVIGQDAIQKEKFEILKKDMDKLFKKAGLL